MWFLVLVLVLMTLLGVLPLQHLLLNRHTSRDLLTSIPLATICVTGQICLLSHIFYLVTTSFASPSISYTFINVIVMVNLWRQILLAQTTTRVKVAVFTVSLASFLVVLGVQASDPRAEIVTVMLSSQYPELFRGSPFTQYLVSLCVQYAIFYLPLHIIILLLCRRRMLQRNTGLRVEKALPSPLVEECCSRCAGVSPFLDLVSLMMGAGLLLARPGYMLGCWYMYGTLLDVDSHFLILPFYTAMCFVNLPVFRPQDNTGGNIITP